MGQLQSLHWPRRRISVTSPNSWLRRMLPAVSLISTMQETDPQSTQTKWGCTEPCDSFSVNNSNRQTRSPSSVFLSRPALAISFKFRKTVALSTPIPSSSSETSACDSGEVASCRSLSVAMRAGVARRPASRIVCLTNSD